MSLTINGATNTLTAASGLAIAGNTAVTGNLSATTYTQSGDLSAVNLQSLTNSAASYANTNNFLRFINSAGNPIGGLTHPAVTTLGLWGNTGVKVIGGNSGATTIADFTTASGLAVYDSATTKTYQLTLNGASSQNLYLGALGSSGQYITGNAKYSGSWTIDDATKGTASVVLVPATGTATAVNFGIGAVNTAPATVASITAAGLAVTGTLSASGITSVTNTTDSSSTSTGALVVSGGVGIAKKTYCGDNIVMASGKGIDFSATSDGSGTTTSEVLSDYEEGTWTPVVSGDGTAGAATYVTQVGRYTKIGRNVTADMYVQISAHTGTGNIAITGLPFTSAADYYSAASIGLVSNYALTAGNIMQAYVGPSATDFAVRQTPAGGGAVAVVPLDTAFQLVLSVTYQV